MKLLRRHEPIIFRWSGGEVSLGYAGNLQWVVKVGGKATTASGVREAIELVFDAVFQEAVPGDEAAARSPLHLYVGGEHLRLFAEPKFINGWRFTAPLYEGTVGAHVELLGFVAERVARAAEGAWANGVRPVRPPSGHDLWSDIPEEVWGPDYMSRRKGAGLYVTRYTDNDEGAVENTVAVEFKTRAD